MTDYRFDITEHNGINCLYVMIDGDEIIDTHIPLGDIQKAVHLKGLAPSLPGVGRIKISAGTQIKIDERTVCYPSSGDGGGMYITDADTGQPLYCFSGVEIIHVLDEGGFELDYHVKHQFVSTKKWKLSDAQRRASDLQSQLTDITKEAETLRFKIHQMESDEMSIDGGGHD